MAAAVILTLSACSQNLVFDNDYDPKADNSPLGASTADVFASEYIDDLGSKKVDIGWNRVPDARDSYTIPRTPGLTVLYVGTPEVRE